MRFQITAALALTAASSLSAQVPDLSYTMPVAGSWTYAATADGSEATFSDTAARPQMWVHCTRATRRVTVSKAASAAAPALYVWTSSQTRSVPSSFNAATGRLSIQLQAADTLLDAIGSSRGRIGIGARATPALVVPPWGEVTRVIEDCRV